MKTIPFDLEKAKAGAKVVTRSGIIVNEMFFPKNGLRGGECVITVINGDYSSHFPDGKFLKHSEDDIDLFLLEEDVSVIDEIRSLSRVFSSGDILPRGVWVPMDDVISVLEGRGISHHQPKQ